jgi:hypothetical protein
MSQNARCRIGFLRQIHAVEKKPAEAGFSGTLAPPKAGILVGPLPGFCLFVFGDGGQAREPLDRGLF